jgi:predicted regulator of Ras-like GTPase activity (Roadblock/LC7/MglB family)
LNATNDLLQGILTKLKNLGNIEACAIVSRDGILIRSDLPDNLIAQTFAAMSATMLGAAETAAAEFNKELPGRVIVESKTGTLICMGAGTKALLVAMAEPDADLGPILAELEKATSKIQEIIT